MVKQRYTYLMPLRVSVPQPHFCVDPVQFRIVWCPYWVGLTGHLMKLYCYGNKISIASDVEQAHSWAGVTPLHWLIFLAIVWDVFENLKVNHVHPAILKNMVLWSELIRWVLILPPLHSKNALGWDNRELEANTFLNNTLQTEVDVLHSLPVVLGKFLGKSSLSA